jgi:hypothetical protein
MNVIKQKETPKMFILLQYYILTLLGIDITITIPIAKKVTKRDSNPNKDKDKDSY